MSQSYCNGNMFMGHGPAHRCGSVWGTMIQCDKCKAKDEANEVTNDLLSALEEVFIIGDRLVSDVYGSEFVAKAKAAIAKARGIEQ